MANKHEFVRDNDGWDMTYVLWCPNYKRQVLQHKAAVTCEDCGVNLEEEKRTTYTQEQLEEAFSKVQNKKDWKEPIYATVDARENLHLIREAIIHFTATVPTFDLLSVQEDGTKILVRADGYRRGPAGDH